MLLFDKLIETDVSFYKHLVKIAIPVVLQALITTGVGRSRRYGRRIRPPACSPVKMFT